MKKIYFIIFLFLPLSVFGQTTSLNVISSAGETSQNDYGKMEWTLGEMVSEPGASQTHQVTQGFQQGNLSVSTLTPEQPTKTKVIAYPNPVKDQLTIESDHSEIIYQVLDMQGNIVLKGAIKRKIGTVNFSTLPSGIYMLITKDKHRFRIVKQ